MLDDTKILKIAQSIVHPNKIYREEKTPVGWVFWYQHPDWVACYRENKEYRGTNALVGSCRFLVNRWTGEATDWTIADRTLDVFLRKYLSGLPLEQQAVAWEEWDTMPYAPVRFYPPEMELGESVSVEELENLCFEVEFDTSYFLREWGNLPELKPGVADSLETLFATLSGPSNFRDLVCLWRRERGNWERRCYRLVPDWEAVQRRRGRIDDWISPFVLKVGGEVGSRVFIAAHELHIVGYMVSEK